MGVASHLLSRLYSYWRLLGNYPRILKTGQVSQVLVLLCCRCWWWIVASLRRSWWALTSWDIDMFKRYVKLQTTITCISSFQHISLGKIHGFYGFMFCGFLPISLRPVFREALKEKLKKENGLEGVEARCSFSRCTQWHSAFLNHDGILHFWFLFICILWWIKPALNCFFLLIYTKSLAFTGHQSPALFYQSGGDGDSWSQSSLHQSGVYTSRWGGLGVSNIYILPASSSNKNVLNVLKTLTLSGLCSSV